MNKEEFEIVEMMRTYGGGFIKALAECFQRADRINFIKLKEAFTNYWDMYEGLRADEIKKQKEDAKKEGNL